MALHAAKLDKSDRLKRVDELLSDGYWHSTMMIIEAACVCAVNSIVSELRANGRTIICRRIGGVWFYKRESV